MSSIYASIQSTQRLLRCKLISKKRDSLCTIATILIFYVANLFKIQLILQYMLEMGGGVGQLVQLMIMSQI